LGRKKKPKFKGAKREVSRGPKNLVGTLKKNYSKLGKEKN